MLVTLVARAAALPAQDQFCPQRNDEAARAQVRAQSVAVIQRISPVSLWSLCNEGGENGVFPLLATE